jgi:hypothetical protein
MPRKLVAKLTEKQLRFTFEAPKKATVELSVQGTGENECDQRRDPRPFQRAPDEHRRVAARLRARKDPKLLELAVSADAVAYVIEQRLGVSTPSPPLAPGFSFVPDKQ